jgi:hypothetical protein
MIDVKCPNLMYEELNGFQSDCEIFWKLFWLLVSYSYQI